MIHEIGETAGKVWQVLNEHGESTPAKVKKQVGASTEVLYQGIGWLAREDMVSEGETLGKDERSIKTTL